MPVRRVFCLAALALSAGCIAACSPASKTASPGSTSGNPLRIRAVGAENFYADVIGQIGGPHVDVHSILSNPNTDPHTYESSTADASAVGSADLIVQNGIGYDAFMQKLEAASPRSGRTVIDVGNVFGKHAGDNPHLWYLPGTMPKVAALVAAPLAKLDPPNAKEYEANRARFVASLQPWIASIAAANRAFKGTPVAVTEPVFNYTAAAIGLDIRTPVSFQLAVEEGNDPAPQDVATVRSLLAGKTVRAFIYNQQTVEPTTARLLDLARVNRVPVIGVYETMPAGMHYQQWMAAEVAAIERALKSGTSTERLR